MNSDLTPSVLLTLAKSGLPLATLRNTLFVKSGLEQLESWSPISIACLTQIRCHLCHHATPSLQNKLGPELVDWISMGTFHLQTVKLTSDENIALNPTDLRRQQNLLYSSRGMPKSCHHSHRLCPWEGGELWFSSASELMSCLSRMPNSWPQIFSSYQTWMLRQPSIHKCPALIQCGDAHVEMYSEMLQPQKEHCSHELLFLFSADIPNLFSKYNTVLY